MYIKAIKGCKWLTPQLVHNNVVHSYWAFPLKLDTLNYDVSWGDFRESFISNGGKSFYGAWSLSYLEPSLLGMDFSDIKMTFKEGLCPVAELIQPNLIQLKTNFESMEIAEKQASILSKTIDEISSS